MTNLRPVPRLVSLLRVQRRSLQYLSEGILNILEFLKLQNLTSLDVDTTQRFPWSSPTLPVTPFDEKIPNPSKLPEMAVYIRDSARRVVFRSPQALLQHHAAARRFGENPYHRDYQP